MFSSKLHTSIRLNNIAVRTCKDSKQCIRFKEQLRFLCILTEKDSESVNQESLFNITLNAPTWEPPTIRSFSSEPLPSNADVFGDIGTREFDKVEMDEKEKKVEEFEENEGRIPRKDRMSPGQYADLIKSHIQNGDLASAERVLEIVKKNRDKPTLYMYNLLLRAFAVHGDLKKCFKLYNKLKQRGMKPNDATITSLFNACSNSMDEDRSLEAVQELRSYLYNRNYKLNATHYNTLVKAYARHQQVEEAFQMLDEMRDKHLNIDDVTFNNLLHGATTEKKTGIKYALVVWHLMKLRNVKPALNTYNLMLRVIRDTNLGDLKVNDVLLAESEKSKIIISDGGRPDLLASPPVVRSVPLLSVKYNIDNKYKNTSEKEETLPAEQDASQEDLYPQQPLEEIVKNNRLILFGGFDGIVKRMENDNVVPDMKTMTLLLELIPSNIEAEKHVIRYARSKKISLDIDFYNVLIKKRCFRFAYNDAKTVLSDIEKEGLQPDIFTWGVLALACQSREEGEDLLNCLDSIGITPNYFIYGALFRGATKKLDINYLIKLMESMIQKQVRPSKEIYSNLDKFKNDAAKAIQEKKSTIRDLTRFKIDLTKFKVKYAKWQKQTGRDKSVYTSSME